MRAAALLAAVTLLSAPCRAGTVAYAIVVGNNAVPTGGSSSLKPLRYADDDAVRYYQLFQQFAAETVLLTVLDVETQRRYPDLGVVTQPPTLANLRESVRALMAKMRAARARGDTPIFYFAFSGHGSRTGSGEPLLALLDGGLTQRVLFDQILAVVPAAMSHLIIDACHAGAVVGVRGMFDRELESRTAPVSPAEIVQAGALARFPTVGIIVATTVSQEAYEWSQVESGVFTHEVVSGLLGPADINGDRRIEYTELQAFVASANRRLADPRATPQVIARPPSANHHAPIVSLGAFRGSRLLVGRAGRLGHFHIELANGQRYLDAHLNDDVPVTIALPGRILAFLRTGTQEASVGPDASSPIALSRLTFRPLTAAPRGSIDESLRAALFSSPYSPSYYQGFVDSVGAISVGFPAPVPAVTIEGSPGPSRRRWLAGSLLVTAGVAAVASLTTGGLALKALSDVHDTDLQRPAYEADERYSRYATTAVITAAVAVVSGVAGYWLWPRAAPTVEVQPSRGGQGTSVAAGVRLAW